MSPEIIVFSREFVKADTKAGMKRSEMTVRCTAARHESDILCALCAPVYFIGLCAPCGKKFNRKERRDLRKGRKEKCQVIAGLR